MKHYISIRAFASYTRQFQSRFWLVAIVFALSNIIIALVPWVIGQLTNSLTQQNDNLTLWTVMIIAVSIGHDALWRCGEILYMKLLLARSHRIDDAMFHAVLQHNYNYFVDKFTGKISSYVTSLGRDYRELMDNFQYQYVGMVTTLPIIALTMFAVNIYTGLIFVVSIALMFLAGRKLAVVAAKAERVESDEQSTMDGYIVDAISNFVSVKAFGSERRESARLSSKRASLIAAAESSYFKAILFWGTMSLFVRWIIWPSTFLLNIYLFTQGAVTIAEITTFLAVIVLFSNYIWEVVWNISQLTIKLARVEEAYQYLFGDVNVFEAHTYSRPAALARDALKKTLTLKNVSFAYPDKPDAPVLHSVDLTVSLHEKVGIVGPSGGGKSTLIKLLLGHYPITAGSVLVDDNPIDNRQLSEITSYVPQDTAMFHRTIAENIAYAKEGASRQEIIAAATYAQAHDFIMALPKGYDTPVGERGIKLSGGQRQRIAIARALLKDAPLLMLDEATSALDSESEQYIQKALDKLLKHRTAIVIAHRLSTIQHMDRIIVLDNGRIIEEGSHSELLKHKGIYASLWKHQSGGFIEE